MQALPKHAAMDSPRLTPVPRRMDVAGPASIAPGARIGVAAPGAAEFQDLGRHLAALYALPYQPLMDTIPAYEARRLLSYDCACRWQVLPLAFDAGANRLTIAIHDPSQTERIEQMYRFFMQDLRLEFHIACEAEIRAVFEKHFSEGDGGRRRWLLRPLVRQDTPAPCKGEPRRLSAIERSIRSLHVNSTLATCKYADMSRSLLNAVAIIVANRLRRDGPTGLTCIRERVRYCHLLAAGFKLGQKDTDGLILAAWLSAIDDPADLISQLGLPYPVDAILQRRPGSAGETGDVADILSLVTAYQDAKAANPAVGRDVTLTRRMIRQAWHASAAKADKLEALLHILISEKGGDASQASDGKILIVDATEVSRAALSPPLRGDGYEVRIAAGVRAAERKMENWLPDLVIAAPALPDGDGLAFCEALKRCATTRTIPVAMLCDAADDTTMSAAFKAGADDILPAPVNPELLFVRVQKLIRSRQDSPDEAGDVKGRLTDMSFADLVQVLSASGKRVELALRGERGTGRVRLDGSQVVDAEAPGLRGAEAFYEIMQWQGADFRTHHCDTFVAETMREPVMALLMEGARRQDEG